MPDKAPEKVIVITGANGGLGRALAQSFAAEGHHVVMLGRSLDKVRAVADAIGQRTEAIACDVASTDSVRSAFEEIAQSHPQIDVLINNAAVFQPFLIEEASDEQILSSVLTNLAGPILCARSAIPLLRRGGHIINVSSESVQVPFPHLLLYQSTKAGLERFSEGLRDELAPRGVRVSVVRAGQMAGPGSSAEMDPVAGARFFEAAMKRGLNLMERGIANYQSATHLFHAIINSPPDMHLGVISFQARPID